MRRRSLLIGLAATALPLPARAAPPIRWHSLGKRLLRPGPPFDSSPHTATFPLYPDLPALPVLALKLTGGPLHLLSVSLRYTDHNRETIGLAPLERRRLTAPFAAPRPLRAVEIAYAPFGGGIGSGHRYLHLIGTADVDPAQLALA